MAVLQREDSCNSGRNGSFLSITAASEQERYVGHLWEVSAPLQSKQQCVYTRGARREGAK
jgi:hypothetical protein